MSQVPVKDLPTSMQYSLITLYGDNVYTQASVHPNTDNMDDGEVHAYATAKRQAFYDLGHEGMLAIVEEGTQFNFPTT